MIIEEYKVKDVRPGKNGRSGNLSKTIRLLPYIPRILDK